MDKTSLSGRVRSNCWVALLTLAATACEFDTTNATVEARIQLVNSTSTSYELRSGDNLLSNTAAAAFGAASGCGTIDAERPDVRVVQTGASTTVSGSGAITGAGKYTVVVLSNSAGAPLYQIIELPVAGSGAQVLLFNATTASQAFDVYVTAPTAPLTTPTTASLLPGAFFRVVNLAAGTYQVRFTNAGTTTVVVDAGTFTLGAAEGRVVIAAPPAASTTTLRAVSVPSC